MKKVPMRMCVVCRNMKPKAELIRVVVGEEEQIIIDSTGKMPGRGAYVCNGDCVKDLQKRRSFERALGGKTSEDLFNKIKGTAFNDK